MPTKRESLRRPKWFLLTLLALKITCPFAEAADKLQPRSPVPTLTPGSDGISGSGMNDRQTGQYSGNFGVKDAPSSGMDTARFGTPGSGLETVRNRKTTTYLAQPNDPDTESDNTEYDFDSIPEPLLMRIYTSGLPEDAMMDLLRVAAGSTTPQGNNRRQNYGARTPDLSTLDLDASKIPYTGSAANTEPDEFLFPVSNKATDLANSFTKQLASGISALSGPSKDSAPLLNTVKSLFSTLGLRYPEPRKTILGDHRQLIFPDSSTASFDAANSVVPLIPQDESSAQYKQGFVITPSGISSATLKLNAIVDPHKDLIVAAQYEYLVQKASKWALINGVLFLAGTDYFVYVCQSPGQKSGFQLGLWTKFNQVSESCPPKTKFYYSGWDRVKSTKRLGTPAAEAGELRFNAGVAVTGKKDPLALNNRGFFASLYPTKNWQILWDTRRSDGDSGKVLSKLPLYQQMTTLPAYKTGEPSVVGANEDSPFWLSIGNVPRTGNPIEKGWTIKDVINGSPIQLQSFDPQSYPVPWFLTRVEPYTDPFGTARDQVSPGTDVVVASMDAQKIPGVWWFNKHDSKLYLYGTQYPKFMYTCRSSGAFLRVGTEGMAAAECKNDGENE
ncbi:hypothetical protein DRE_01454 [Drechslerella stenobrocha 248]|uniref:MACPF domain-containing protein n=1 Tax=Drechslerella stenobrocha 248 TaxID=1043628 RepID=W7HU27_9PEZI|nr:hypothetical protein DRE_01454 [Drechslerella stenobrocha 248]